MNDRPHPRWKRFVAPVVFLVFALLGWLVWAGWREVQRDPVVMRQDLVVDADIPKGALRIAFVSDIHAGWPDMDEARLARLVRQVNALQADLILLGGDYIKAGAIRVPATSDGTVELKALSALHAPLGVVAVLGNHDCADNRAEAFAAQLRTMGITVLRNQALIGDSVAVLGVDDVIHCQGNMGPVKRDFGRQIALWRQHTGQEGWPYPVIQLSHEAAFARYAPDYVDLAFAGHTHGGQLIPAVTGRLIAWHNRMPAARGFLKIGSLPFVLSSGAGASGVPLRLGVPPEIWLVTLKPSGKIASAKLSATKK